MSSVDGNALTSLTESVLKNALDKRNVVITKSMTDIHAHAKRIAEGNKKRLEIYHSKKSPRAIVNERSKEKRDQRETISDQDSIYHTELRTGIVFPSDNEFGIPNLLPAKLYSESSRLPVDTFAKANRTLMDDFYYCESSRPFDGQNHRKPIGGYLGFYCEDSLIDKYYVKPDVNAEKLVEEQWFAIFEPDFSTYFDWPMAVRLWSVYRSRWCCRYWQELGIDVIPIIRRTNDVKRDAPWLYNSLPEKLTVAAMQLRMGGKKNVNDPMYWNAISSALHHVKDRTELTTIMFHGNPKFEKYIIGKVPDGVTYQFITPFIDRRRELGLIKSGRPKNS